MNNMTYIARKNIEINMEFSAVCHEYNELRWFNSTKNAYDLPILDRYHYLGEPFIKYDYGFLSIVGQYKILYD